jgi:D-2-hydroxyacid dehydrogenase (NADP+)
MTTKNSIGVLLSKDMHSQIGEHLQNLARACGHALHFVISPQQPGSLPSPAEQASIRLAYYSRDFLNGGTKTAPSPATSAFFDVVDAAPGVQWVQVCSAGVDMPQYQTTLQRPVRLTNSSGSNAQPVAQTATAAILAQARGFTYWLDAQSKGRWAPLAPAHVPRDLHAQTACIVGLGPIGREIGRLLKAVGFQTIGVRRSTEPVAHFDRVIQLEAIDSVLPDCDWLVLACPLTPETQGMLSASRLALLPRHAGVANIGRGELIDELALFRALDEERLRSAYLDVFSTEPLPSDSPLWTARNTWISPHNAAASLGNGERANDMFLRNFEHWLAGRSLDNESATERAGLPARGQVL